jgi:uncharacterized integral membrane protein
MPAFKYVSLEGLSPMTNWTALGIFLLGAGVGALLTAIFYAARIRDLRTTIEEIQGRTASQPDHAA